MAITTLDQYIGSYKQRVGWFKSASITTVAYVPFSLFDQAGNPGSGTLAGTTTASAILQTDLIAGYPAIDAATGVNSYLTKIEFGWPVIGRLRMVDVIAKSGPYSYATGTTTLTSYPSITGRCPDYGATAPTVYGARNEIWIEVSTAFVTGTAWQVQCTYANQSGVTATTIISAAQAAAALTKNKLFQLALQSGDTGVQKVYSVIVTNGGTIMTAGAFNVLLVRELWTSGRVRVANDGSIHDMLTTGMPIVYPDSALTVWVQTDSTASNTPELFFELASNG
jgi:hypothetical protein